MSGRTQAEQGQSVKQYQARMKPLYGAGERQHRQTLFQRHSTREISKVRNMPNTGVIVVDSSAAVLFANGIAERLLAVDMLCHGLDGICVPDPIANGRLRKLITTCTEGNRSRGKTGGIVELHDNERQPRLRIEISPIADWRADPRQGVCRDRLALLLVSNPKQEWLDRATELQHHFRLTPAEGKFALEILKGDGRAAAAARLNITTGTAHAHLTRIFEKTGVRRQAELVRLLLSGS